MYLCRTRFDWGFLNERSLSTHFFDNNKAVGIKVFLMHLYNLVLFINHQQPFNYGYTKPKRWTFHQRLGLQIWGQTPRHLFRDAINQSNAILQVEKTDLSCGTVRDLPRVVTLWPGLHHLWCTCTRFPPHQSQPIQPRQLLFCQTLLLPQNDSLFPTVWPDG